MNAEDYNPDTVDLTHDHDATEYWLQCFQVDYDYTPDTVDLTHDYDARVYWLQCFHQV